MEPKPETGIGLIIAAYLSALASILVTLSSYRAYATLFALDCGTGRSAAVGTLFFSPLLLALPGSLWILGAMRKSGLARLGRNTTFWPLVIWSIAVSLVSLAEHYRGG